jgi:di/tricarboxylate transporter
MIEQMITESAVETLKITLTFVILGGTIYGFIAEKIPPGIVSLLTMLTLILAEILAPQEAFAGLSHPATISLAAVLVLSSAVERIGLLTVLARRVLVPLGTSEWRLTALVMVVIATISAFLNNTAAVGMPTATAALSGCAMMVLTGCLRPRDAYQSIDLSLVGRSFRNGCRRSFGMGGTAMGDVQSSIYP